MATSKKIILLDLGGVVFQSSGTSNEQINWEIINQLNEKHGTDLNLGKDKFPAFLKDYNQLTNQTLSGTKFLAYVFDTLSINSELIELVSGYGDIIIVSDNYRENIAYISKRFNFEDWAIQQFYSFDYQMYKANPLFFKRLLEDLKDYSKENMIFIDDSPKKLESAALHGIEGILFQNNQEVKEQLQKWSMKKAFEQYRFLLEREGDLHRKKIDHCQVIDLYYADQIEQVENSAAPIIGKEHIKKMELKNLEGVRSVKTTLKNIVIEESNGLVWGEMVIQFDSIKLGKKRIEEAFMQRWENDKIVFLRFFYGEILEDTQ